MTSEITEGTESRSERRAFIEAVRRVPTASIEAHVARFGRRYESAKLTPEELQIVLAAAALCRNRFPEGRCFDNAQRLVLADRSRSLTYVEGLVHNGGWQLLFHGWATINDKVVDVTLRNQRVRGRAQRLRGRVIGEIPHSSDYSGCEFEFAGLHAHVERVRRLGLGFSAVLPTLDSVREGSGP